MAAFKSNKYLKEIVGGIRIKKSKAKKFNMSSETGKCTPYSSGARNLCCMESSDTNNHIHKSIGKANTQYFFQP